MYKKNKTHISDYLTLIGIGLGVFFWVLESAIHVFIFHEGTLLEQVFFPDFHEVWMRLLVAYILAMFGAYSQFLISSRKLAEDAITAASVELNQIFNTAADGMRVVDKDFNVLKVNDTFCVMSGISRDEATGKKCYQVFHGSMCHTPECPLRRILRGEQRVECDVAKERNIDGVKIPCILSATPFRDHEGKIIGIVENFKDITVRKMTEKKLQILSQEFQKSSKRFKQLALKDSHTGLYNHRYLNEAIEAEFMRSQRSGQPFSVMMLDIDYFKSVNDVYGHQFGDLVLKQLARLLKRRVRPYDTVVRFGGEEFIIMCAEINRAATLALAQRILEAVNLYNFGDEKQVVKIKISLSVASYPEDKIVKAMDLIEIVDQILNRVKQDGGNRIYSSIDIKSGSPSVLEDIERSGEQDIEFLKEKIEKLKKRANQSIIESVVAFARTIRLRDSYTGEHVERIVRYSTEIAEALNLPREQIELIKQASLLHDLGKIGISDEILLKNSKLTTEEFEEIKKHPQIAVDIIRPIHSLHNIIPLIFYHQERWDGGGYPRGLKGDQIPIGARIVAIADVYQALISDRPYRKAYSKEGAVKVIKEGSGTQFDPKIVNAFLRILEKEDL